MSREIHIQTMTPELVKDAEAAHIGDVIKRLAADHSFVVVVVGPREQAEKFVDTELWHLGAPESPA